MAYQLRIQSGANKGRVYDLKPGAIIGRGNADVPLDDPKVSNRHAKIETAGDGTWFISDLGSTNGIKVGGKRQSKVTIAPGLVVKVGNSLCEFIELSKVGWSDYLSDFSKSCAEKVTPSPQPGRRLSAFKPILILTFTRGPQAGTEWSLGYGPRQVGRSALDLHIMDPQAPDLVCTLTPKGVSAFFETAHPDKVRLNGRSISSEILKAGDEIQVAESTLRVSFEE